MASPLAFSFPQRARFSRYLEERFPLAAYAPLVLAFAGAGVGVAGGRLVDVLAAAGSLLVAFLHLRIADEHKDAAIDARYRSERPVPRGLVTLGELRVVAAAGVAFQVAVAVAFGQAVGLSLLLVWGYTALMTAEFGCPAWLRVRPAAYLLSHLAILPLLAVHAAAFGEGVAPGTLALLAGAAYGGGVVLEVGRKLRAPADERPGVETYSAVWGVPVAVAVWLAGIAASAICTGLLVGAVVGVLLPLAGAAGWQARSFVRRPDARRARRFEPLSGLWLLSVFALIALHFFLTI